MPNITPLGDNVLIEPEIDDKEDVRFVKGTVIAVGPGSVRYGQFVATTVKPGAVILFRRYGELDPTGLLDEKYLLVDESELEAEIE